MNEDLNEMGAFSVISDIEGADLKSFIVDLPDEMPVLPLRNMILFPFIAMPVAVGRESSLRLVNEAIENGQQIAVVCQKSPEINNPRSKDIFSVGVVAKIVKVLSGPDETKTVLLQGLQRVKIKSIVSEQPYLVGAVEGIPDGAPEKNKQNEYSVVVDTCREKALQLARMTHPLSPEFIIMLKNVKHEDTLINTLCSSCDAKIAEKAELLEADSMPERAYRLLKVLNKNLKVARLKAKIEDRTRIDLEKQQREFYLHQQMKVIHEELGGAPSQDQDIAEMRRKASTKQWSEEVAAIFEKEVAKLERLNIQSPDYNVQLNYLQVMLSLPWGECTEDNLDIKNAKAVLEKDHYGMDKVKERILEHLAVIKMRGDLKSPIICLYGPPGVGKTSLGRSIAAAMKRKYVRMSLGGVHDESEVRGHRKTYIGAMPGRILKGIMKAGTDNPVFILDEIDKVGKDTMHGDPASALLEVLDPEQNNAFHDNFLDVDYDLSKVMFIATANNLSSIPAPLLDRMELIEVSGYLTEEKIEIARRHLIPDEKEANGIGKEKITIKKKAIENIIEGYTRESGVRELKKKIGKAFRRIVFNKAMGNEADYSAINPEQVGELLGPVEFTRDTYQGNNHAGVVVGLAWTAVGGEILYIETSLSRGKEDKVTFTGNLGDVMKESAMLAMEYVKSHAQEIGIDQSVFGNWNVHLHVPEGAIPKDGPSAGITMATAIASVFTQRRVKANIAMTGEITLRGKVLPVGGLKEKILAAKRAGIKEIILCAENKRNIDVIPESYLKGLEIHYVNNVSEVLDIALLDTKVDNPINLTDCEI
ncbi:MAG: endopeptidase La [Bacteroidaceae bacterium]|nr:endopeptidase La [Bacteroidaceae bacterium]